MIKTVIVTFTLLIGCIGIIFGHSKTHTSMPVSQEAESQNQWIARSLREMEGIKPGMTRSDLMKVFTVEGGLSTGLKRTYVYQHCPYLKVDVEFRAVGRPDKDKKGRVTLVESDADVITRISRPYLAWSVVD
jgi:hypothetical protein